MQADNRTEADLGANSSLYETHARGRRHRGQCRRQSCNHDAQRNLNKSTLQLHGFLTELMVNN